MSDAIEKQNDNIIDFYKYIPGTPPEWVEISTLPPVTDRKTNVTVKPKYMTVANRQKWAYTVWYQGITRQADEVFRHIVEGTHTFDECATLLRNMGFHIHAKVEKLEIVISEREKRGEDDRVLKDSSGNPITEKYQDGVSYCLASCYIRDPFGSDATDFGYCTLVSFKSFVEKALTKALGRALRLLGFGTDFAIDMDEEDELLSVARDVSAAADSPVREIVQPVKEQPKQAASAPVAAVAPVQEQKAATPKVEAAPAATTNVRAMTGITPRTKARLLELVPQLPAVMNWAAGHFGTERPFPDHASEDQAQKLLFAVTQDRDNDHPNLLDTWRGWLAQNMGGSTPEDILNQWKRDGVNGMPYREFAKQYGYIVPDESPAAQPEPQYVEDTDPEGKDFNEEVEAPLEEAATETLLRPNDPESPTEEQSEQWMALMKQLGSPREHPDFLQDLAAKVGLWTDGAIRKQYLPGLPEGTKGNPKLCWTRKQYDDAIAMIREYLKTIKKAA